MTSLNPIRTVLVDDEPLARKSLRTLLKPHPEFVLAAECKNGPEAVALLNAQPAELVFLDIQMPEMDGFGVLARLNRPLPIIVFVTAFDQFAIRAFEVNAVDYLLKPVEDARFTQALARAKSLLERQDTGQLEAKLLALLAEREALEKQPPTQIFARRLAVRSGSRLIFVEVEDIDYIQANDYYSAIHIGPKTHLLREPMKELEAKLDPAKFIRIHRSAIVNAERVRELRHRPSGGYAAVLQDGTSLSLSRARWEQVQAALSS